VSRILIRNEEMWRGTETQEEDETREGKGVEDRRQELKKSREKREIWKNAVQILDDLWYKS